MQPLGATPLDSREVWTERNFLCGAGEASRQRGRANWLAASYIFALSAQVGLGNSTSHEASSKG